MTSKIYPGLAHLNGNLMAAVDVETTGRRPGYHEIIQVAVVPLDSDFRMLNGVTPFSMYVAPKYPLRQEKQAGYVHDLSLEDLVLTAPDAGRVADMLVEWFQRLELPLQKNLVPLAHNWAFEYSFLTAWLGDELRSTIFHGHARDAMLTALQMNDRAAFAGQEVPFARVGLQSLCNRLGVVNQRPHDALADSLAEAEVYRALCLNLMAV